MMRRLRLLIALAGLCAACGPVAEEPSATESATNFPNIGAQADAVWSYYTGNFTGARPSMLMFQPDKTCSPLYLGNGLYAYRIGRLAGACNSDTGQQSNAVPYNFYATYEIWEDRAPVPGIQQPWYATLAVNFLCMAAYERAGFTYLQAFPYCDGSASSTVPTVRHLIHDIYSPSYPFWQ